jgi:two-component system sensor histidine kinase/response regulator
MNQSQFIQQDIVLKDAVEDVIHLLNVPAEEKQIELKAEIPENLTVFADADMLSFVLRNLLVNALKFTDDFGRIEMKAYQEGESVVFEIKDTGIGISEEDLPKLFTYQHHFSTQGTRKEKGTGLGLLLCKEFVEKNKGKISVSSRKGEGSVFKIILPKDETV